MSAQVPETIEIGGALVVNRLGFGAMRITGTGVWGEPPDPAVARSVLVEAVRLGVNFIDTADAYGPAVSEELIFAALHPYPEDLVIATKGGLVRPGPGRWEPDGRPEHLREACEESLRRLGLEVIPLYQFHRPDPAVPFAESIGALADLQRAGKITHIGLSNVDEAQLREAQQLVTVVSVQNRYNLADRSSESLLETCEREAIAFLPWAPLRSADEHSAAARIAAERKLAPEQVVLAYLLARSPVMLPIPGTGSIAHLRTNQEARSIELSAEDLAALAAA